MMLASFRRRVRIGAALLTPALILNACYRVVPVRTDPLPGAELVVDLTSEATERLGGFLGRGTVSARGRLLAWERDSIVLAVLATENTEGTELLWRRERVGFPRHAVARVTERRLNRGRTSLLALGVGAVLATAVVLATAGQGGGNGGGTKPAPQ